MNPYIVVPRPWVSIATAVITLVLVTLKAVGVLSTVSWILILWPAMAVVIFCLVLSVSNWVTVRMEVEMSMFARWWKENRG